MGNCRYCNTKAGLFKDVHEACSRDADVAEAELQTLMTMAVESGVEKAEFDKRFNGLMERGRLSVQQAKSLALKFADDVTHGLAMGSPVSNEEAERIGEIFKSIDAECFNDPQKLITWEGYVALIHSNVLYQVMHKEVPYYNAEAFRDFRLEDDEHPILRRYATLAEYKTISTGQTYQSVSVPIGGGIYYRLGASQPRSTQTGLVHVADGLLLITTKALYFSSPITTFQISYYSIIRIESFVDGFGIYENYGTGKVFIPALLGTKDEGWYFYNLVSALMLW